MPLYQNYAYRGLLLLDSFSLIVVENTRICGYSLLSASNPFLRIARIHDATSSNPTMKEHKKEADSLLRACGRMVQKVSLIP